MSFLLIGADRIVGRSLQLGGESTHFDQQMMEHPSKKRVGFSDTMSALNLEFHEAFGSQWEAISSESESPIAEDSADSRAAANVGTNPYHRGAHRSWVPLLGDPIWETHDPYFAYIGQMQTGELVGFVRIPDYRYDLDKIRGFSELVARFQEMTSTLVVDQINNDGGNMLHMYKILSALTNRPLALPTHQLSLTSEDERKAAELLNRARTPGPDKGPSAAALSYSRFVLSEIEAGRARLTNPIHLFGITEIIPAKIHYGGRLIVLINALDFSAAEFLAAVLQDNERATLFGERTAGAGGCVRSLFPALSHDAQRSMKMFGVAELTYTWTLAWRTNGSPIQDTGVEPDVAYSITVEDLQGGYAGYRHALLNLLGIDH